MLSRTFVLGIAGIAAMATLTFAVISAPTQTPQEPSRTELKRKPWNGSTITGSPERPPKFKAVRAFPEVKFTQPLLIARCPGSDRLFFGERPGALFSVKPGEGAKAELFFDLRKELKTLDLLPSAKGVDSLYALAFHPKFQENRYCYLCYTLKAKEDKVQFLENGSRISRFSVTKTDPPRIEPNSEEILLTFEGGGHNGCDLHFGPDGMLYISTGDARSPNPPDPLHTGQDCSDLLSSILRIDVDRKDGERLYGIPKDNPFVGMKNVRPEVWAFGFRNPWRMSFDRSTGDLWVGDVGWELWEMIHKVEKGGNYGWSITEARQPINPNQPAGPTPIRSPAIELSHTIAASVTGGYVYRGKKFPELQGSYIFGDWETRRLWAAKFENGRLKEMPEIVKPNIRVVTFGEDHDGELYFLDYDTGFVHTLERNEGAVANTQFPTKLSQTGLFKSVKDHEPADGVIPFEPNAQQWQDGAIAEHYIALPGSSFVKVFEKARPLPGQVYWHKFGMQFPKDAVLVKTIKLDVLVGEKEVRKRVETQILHHDGEDWRGYTYAWRDDQTDADIVPADGDEKSFTVRPWFAPQEKREQIWTFHSRNQCVNCHNAWSQYTLAFNIGQLNNARSHAIGQPSRLVSLCESGVLQRIGEMDQPLTPFDKLHAQKEPEIPHPFAATFTLEERARAYLHVNCAHCHRFGGGGGQVVLELDYFKALKDTGILNARPRQGDFGLKDAHLISPQNADKSVLFYRMAKFGRGRMPHLGSELPHPDGLKLIADWINTIGEPKLAPKATSRPPIDRLAQDMLQPASALQLAMILAKQDADAAYLKHTLESAAKLESGPVRDLFEGYLPTDSSARKLGSTPRPNRILNLKGDAKNGETLFLNKEMKCASCHKVGDRGVAVGPDLTAIGKARTRLELLESLLQPSLRIEPQYASYLVRTLDDKTLTGLLIKRDEKVIIIRDAENKEHRFASTEVDSLTPSRLSMMPDGQMSGLTPQEAADLLEYLTTRK